MIGRCRGRTENAWRARMETPSPGQGWIKGYCEAGQGHPRDKEP